VIEFDLPRAGNVELALFDLAGRHLRTLWSGERADGPARSTWDGRDERGRVVATGIYLCRIQALGRSETHRIVWTRGPAF
jgi:hypothetical protein